MFQNKRTVVVLIKYIFKKLSSEEVESSDAGGYSWYAKLHNCLGKFFQRKLYTFQFQAKI